MQHVSMRNIELIELATLKFFGIVQGNLEAKVFLLEISGTLIELNPVKIASLLLRVTAEKRKEIYKIIEKNNCSLFIFFPHSAFFVGIDLETIYLDIIQISGQIEFYKN